MSVRGNNHFSLPVVLFLSLTRYLRSTTHRVLSPERGAGPRFSIPFFQGVSYDATFESMDVPVEVKRLRQEVIEKNGMRRDDIEFTFSKGRWGHLGEATLMNRVKSHPDVGERWVCYHAI